MKIAICEDEYSEAAQMEQFISQLPYNISCQVFYSAEELLGAYTVGERFDLIFMDIQMKGQSGFDAAKLLRKDYPDSIPLIVFVTVLSSYAPYGYGIAWRYVLKPTDISVIHNVINAAVAHMERHNIVLETTEGTVCIEEKSIVYIEANYGDVMVFTTTGTYRTKQSLVAVSELLSSGIIVQVHRSFFVNISYIAAYKGNDIFLSNNERIPIGRNKRNDFISALTVYLRGKRYGNV